MRHLWRQGRQGRRCFEVSASLARSWASARYSWRRPGNACTRSHPVALAPLVPLWGHCMWGRARPVSSIALGDGSVWPSVRRTAKHLCVFTGASLWSCSGALWSDFAPQSENSAVSESCFPPHDGWLAQVVCVCVLRGPTSDAPCRAGCLAGSQRKAARVCRSTCHLFSWGPVLVLGAHLGFVVDYLRSPLANPRRRCSRLVRPIFVRESMPVACLSPFSQLHDLEVVDRLMSRRFPLPSLLERRMPPATLSLSGGVKRPTFLPADARHPMNIRLFVLAQDKHAQRISSAIRSRCARKSPAWLRNARPAPAHSLSVHRRCRPTGPPIAMAGLASTASCSAC